MYYKGNHGYILLYDTTQRASFESMENWLKSVENWSSLASPKITLVGNKCDLEDSREMSYEEGKAFAELNKLEFFEASVKLNINIEKIIVGLIERILDDEANLQSKSEFQLKENSF